MNHTNALIDEKSPYLLQHAHNPVDWLPWGDEAFARARAEEKPVFLSVGYSTCHWCHVMEHESFEDEEVALFLNAHFVPVKVDREERPDVDRLFMTFVQAATRQGGWPMSVFLTPDGEPFFGGTYFPPRGSHGRPGFLTLLQHLATAWESDRGRVLASAGNAMSMLRDYATAGADDPGDTDWKALCDTAFETFSAGFDSQFGGFGDAPKFPRPVTHDFLHRYAFVRGDPLVGIALRMSAFTLRAMSTGGMNDQLGGGFHRYSVDEQWIVPHFEKMLYDQAQLVTAYLEMFQLTADPRYAATARATLDYVLRDMTHSEGGFFAAEDADSLPGPDAQRKIEGAFFVWTAAEFDHICGEDAPMLRRFYGVEPGGNAPRTGDPHGEFQGKNILFEAIAVDDLAEELGLSLEECARRVEAGRQKLFAERESRPRPHRDEKIIVAWNGLMIAAFARAAQVLEEPRYAEAARRAADFIARELWNPATGTLLRHYKDGPASVQAFADDYAFLADGLLDLYEADFDVAHLEWAGKLADTLDRDFYDSEVGGYFNGPMDPRVPVRFKEDYDGAEPAANSVATRVALRLSELFDGATRREHADATLRYFGGRLAPVPHAMPALLGAALRAGTPPLHIVIAGDRTQDDTRALLREVYGHFLPFRSLILVEAENALEERLPFTHGMKTQDGQAAAYVCRDFACRQPVTTPEELRAHLDDFNTWAHGQP